MAEKKLMNYTFASSTMQVNLGCNSTDNVKEQVEKITSDKRRLNQIGCLIFSSGSSYSTDSLFKIQRLSMALNTAGYGERNLLTVSENPNVKFYLVTDDENAPYIMASVYGGEISLYDSENTRIESLFAQIPGSGNSFCCYAGQIDIDGKAIENVDGIALYPNKIFVSPPYYSKKSYKWRTDIQFKDGTQLINSTVASFLKDFQPVEPEGEFVPEGVGDFDTSSDTIDIPDVPSLSAIDTGMLRVYRMTNEELRSLNNFLWSGLFDIDTFKKLFSDPMQALLNLSISPINADVSDSSVIKIGNITSNVTGSPVTSQYKKIDFGTIRLNEFWGSFADYSPYTRLSIYLPYVGVQTISIDDVMNGTIHLVAICDVLTGSVTYILQSNQTNRAGHSHNAVLYSWGGNCHYQIPLTANNMTSVISSIMSITGAIGTTVATGGLSSPLAGKAVASSVGNVMNAKPRIQKSGGLGGSTGIFGVQTPYLILERPEQRTIGNYNSLIGEVSDYTARLGFFNGYVTVKAVHVDNISTASDNEKREIENLLKTGVIV